MFNFPSSDGMSIAPTPGAIVPQRNCQAAPAADQDVARFDVAQATPFESAEFLETVNRLT